MFGASAVLLLALLLNSRLYAAAPMPAEGPQSFNGPSLENPHPDEEDATPRPEKSLTAAFLEEPVIVSSKEMFEENGVVAPAEPNRVTPASASTQEASDQMQINQKSDLELEEREDKFPDVYLEINEGKPEVDHGEDTPSEPKDSLLIQRETNSVPLDSESKKIETHAEIDPASTDNGIPGSSSQTKEEKPIFSHVPAQSVDPPLTETAMKDDDSRKEIPSAAADSIYVAVKRSNLQHRRDFKAAVSSVRGESQAQVNRGAIIGAALITLISFILIGFVGIKISRKLR